MDIKLKNLRRSEEHTSELQSHSEISYAVFCLKKKNKDTKDPDCFSPPTVEKPIRRDAARRPACRRVALALLVLPPFSFPFFFFNDTATTEIYTLSYTLSLHDALPIAAARGARIAPCSSASSATTA